MSVPGWLIGKKYETRNVTNRIAETYWNKQINYGIWYQFFERKMIFYTCKRDHNIKKILKESGSKNVSESLIWVTDWVSEWVSQSVSHLVSYSAINVMFESFRSVNTKISSWLDVVQIVDNLICSLIIRLRVCFLWCCSVPLLNELA